MWEDAVMRVKEKRTAAVLGGGKERIEKQHSQGKLTARERIELLFDGGTFVEVNDLVESRINDFGLDKKRVPGDGVITGYGKIDGRLVFASSEDFTVIGGTLGEYHSMKICKLQDMALNAQAPIICINDSGGARIEEGIDSLSGYSGIFLRHTAASGIIPQIAVIMGPCSGGACYAPAICDFIFMVKGTSKMFITGPQVVKSVINETVTVDELGGTEIHASISGVSHFVYDEETECIKAVRRLLTYLPANHTGIPPARLGRSVDHSDKLIEIVPDNPKRIYDVHDVIRAVTDAESFFEVQKEFARNAVAGLARLDGEVLGLVANQPSWLGGALDCNASDKIARFIRFCDCFNIPLLTLVDVPAFFPGKEQEHKGIIRHGAKILYAYSEATVPKVTLIMRKAYGGAYIAMNSKNMGADIVFAWPIAEIAVMGAEGAVSIIAKRQIDSAADPEEERERLKAEYEGKFSNPFIAAARGFVDEIILPGESKKRIKSAFDMLKNKKVSIPWKKHGNIPL